MDDMALDPLAILRGCGPLSDDSVGSYPDGSHSTIDYRSKINESVHEVYGYGARSVKFNFDRYFAASDALLDVENMLVTAERFEWPADKYAGQLVMYGVLQALAVENQATQQVLNCFGRKSFFSFEEDLDAVKELRIAVAGHPSDHNKKNLKLKGCTFLGHRAFGSRTKFIVVTHANFSQSVQREVDILGLIARQRLAVNANLCRVWDAISKDGGISATLLNETKR